MSMSYISIYLLIDIVSTSSQVEVKTLTGNDAEKAHTTPSSLVAKVKKEPKEVSLTSNVEVVNNIPNRFCDENESPDMHSCIRTLLDIRHTKELMARYQ